MAKDSMQVIYIALGLIFVLLGYVAYEHMNINKKLEKAHLCKAIAQCGTAGTVQNYGKAMERELPVKREKYHEKMREPKASR